MPATTTHHRQQRPRRLITNTDRRTRRRHSARNEFPATAQRSDQQKWGESGSNRRPDGL
jgi:hypothetical protein